MNLKSLVEFFLHFLNNKIQSIFKNFKLFINTRFVSFVKLLIIYTVVFILSCNLFLRRCHSMLKRARSSQVDELIDYSYVTSISFSLFKLQVYGFYCWFHVRVTVHCVLWHVSHHETRYSFSFRSMKTSIPFCQWYCRMKRITFQVIDLYCKVEWKLFVQQIFVGYFVNVIESCSFTNLLRIVIQCEINK